jgi:hypothetical protein
VGNWHGRQNRLRAQIAERDEQGGDNANSAFIQQSGGKSEEFARLGSRESLDRNGITQ